MMNTRSRYAAPFVLTLLALTGAWELAAQDRLPPVEHAFPRDTLVYASADMQGGLSAFTDVEAIHRAGAVGYSFKDLSELARRELKVERELAINDELLQRLIYGSRRMSFGWLDVTVDGMRWMLVLEHDTPTDLAMVLRDLNDAGEMVYKEHEEFDGHQIYTTQVSEDWMDSIQNIELIGDLVRVFRGGGNGGWWGQRTEDAFTSEAYMSTWNDRYVILAGKKNDVLDALTYYDFPEDRPSTLLGRKSFRNAKERYAEHDLMAYWNIATTFMRVERVMAASSSTDLDEFKEGLSIAEVKLLDALTLAGDFDGKTGQASGEARLSFRFKPSWLSWLPSERGKAPHTEFCPPRPLHFSAYRFGKAEKVYRDFLAFFKEKSTAIGRPDAAREMEEGIAEFEERAGFTVDELLEQLGGTASSLMLNPLDEDGQTRDFMLWASVVALRDEAKAEAFMREKLSRTQVPELREYFSHTADVKFVDAGGKRAMYQTFNMHSEQAWSYATYEGVLIMGFPAAVEACLRAKMTGDNLANDEAYKRFRPALPAENQVTGYLDLGFLSTQANKMFGHGREGLRRFEALSSAPLQKVDRAAEARANAFNTLESELQERIMREYFEGLQVGYAFSMGEDDLVLKISSGGLPTHGEVVSIYAESAQLANLKSAREKLRTEVARNVDTYLFKEGELPQTWQEMASAESGLVPFRDPTLAGPGTLQPDDEHLFVWMGDWKERETLIPAVPLAKSQKPDRNGRYLLLMSDHSVHLLTEEEVRQALDAAEKAEDAPFASDEPMSFSGFVDKKTDEARNTVELPPPVPEDDSGSGEGDGDNR